VHTSGADHLTPPAESDAPITGVWARQNALGEAIRQAPVRRRAAVKRTVDIVLGTILLLAALPIVLICALLSAVALRAWPIFVQMRPGRDERPFRIIKIRTMPASAPAYGHKDALASQLRSLPAVCQLLRRTHLDELPQLALVPLGRMSLVGPRPSQPLQYERLSGSFEWMRTAVRPGCTGLWQVGAASSLALDVDPEYDTFYLEHAGFRLDLWILMRTALVMTGIGRTVQLNEVPHWVRGPGLRRPATETPSRIVGPLNAVAELPAAASGARSRRTE
jgi:lipopolysaccharide/colanic/teichoic acid biosynthesis glycosyltransferase